MSRRRLPVSAYLGGFTFHLLGAIAEMERDKAGTGSPGSKSEAAKCIAAAQFVPCAELRSQLRPNGGSANSTVQ